MLKWNATIVKDNKVRIMKSFGDFHDALRFVMAKFRRLYKVSFQVEDLKTLMAGRKCNITYGGSDWVSITKIY